MITVSRAVTVVLLRNPSWGWCTGTTQRDGTGKEEEGGRPQEKKKLDSKKNTKNPTHKNTEV